MCGWLLALLAVGWTSAGGVLAQNASPVRRPNVIVIFTDDQGWADLGCQGVADDVRTPHLDALAARGVRFTSGYITAPQCSPSRAGLLTGRYQQRFGFDNIVDGPLPLDEPTIAERLRDVGYATGFVGKWHLEPNAATRAWNLANVGNEAGPPPRDEHWRYFPQQRGFTDTYKGELGRYLRNYDLDGDDVPLGWHDSTRYRLTEQADAAVAFIDRHADEPFFLLLAYFAPHVPLEATDVLLARFPGEMAQRRRHALAMIAAMDDGVGAIVARLASHGIAGDTLIVFTSDNGAPIKIDKEDRTLEWRGGAWDGSINDPLNGEKGTLLEGGVRVPFVLAWPGVVPGGRVIDTPVISLDLAATALAMAGEPVPDALDGVSLLPLLVDGEPLAERALCWRFWGQAAIRRGDWKLLHLGDGARFLFNLADDVAETRNVIDAHPEIAAALLAELEAWCDELSPPGLPARGLNDQERPWFAAYLGHGDALGAGL